MCPLRASQPARLSLLTVSLMILLVLLAAPPANAADQDPPLRIAVAGLVHGHVEGFLSSLAQHKDVELVGIAEPDPELVQKYMKKYSLPRELFFADLSKLIQMRHPQAVLVYTSVAGHRGAIQVAAQFGVSVMVEKPLTLSLEDALAIRELARTSKIDVLVNYETTWYSSNKAASDELLSHNLGDLRRVVIHDGHQGPSEIGVSPEFLKWLTDPAQNGAGALYDFGCYGVDLMTWLMHGQAPLSVTAVLNHDKPQLYPNVDDDATIVLAYPRAQAVVQASWNWPFSRKDMEVYGSTGYAITVGPDKLRVRHEHDADERLATAPALPAPQTDSLSYLAAVLRGQLVPKGDLTALDTNLVVTQILDAARESARTGKTIQLTPLPE